MFLHPFYMRWGGGPCGASCCPEASPGAVRAPQHTVHGEGWVEREEGGGGNGGRKVTRPHWWSGIERLGEGGVRGG